MGQIARPIARARTGTIPGKFIFYTHTADTQPAESDDQADEHKLVIYNAAQSVAPSGSNDLSTTTLNRCRGPPILAKLLLLGIVGQPDHPR